MMSKPRKKSPIDNFFGSKANRVDNLRQTEDRNNENFSFDSNSTTMTKGEIVTYPLALTEMCRPEPNTNIEDISTF